MSKLTALRNIIDKLFKILLPKHKKKLIPLFINMFLASMLEMIGVAAIIPFINALMTPDKLMRNRYVAIIMNELNISDSYDLLLFMGVGIAFIYIVKNVYLFYSRLYQVKFQCRVQQDLSTIMLNSYMSRSYAYFLDTNSSEVLRGIEGDISGVYNILNNLLVILAECITVLFIGVFIFVTDPILATGVLFIAAFCVILITFGFKSKMRKVGDNNRIAGASKYQTAVQAVSGIKEITVTQRRKFFVEKYDKAYALYTRCSSAYNAIQMAPERIIEASFVSGIILIVVYRIRWGMDVTTYVPRLAAFAIAAFRLLPSINKLSQNMTQIIFYQPALNAAYENIMSAKKFAQEQKDYSAAHLKTDIDDNSVSLSFIKDVKIENISWAYHNSKSDVLSDLSLTIYKGESVALIGESGAGKTTLADCILGLLHPQAGSIKMDGIDIFAIPKTWAHIIGYVPQSVYLIDDTIRANVSFGLNDDEVSDDKIWEALEQAQLSKFVHGLPNGLDTIVGERGVKFSGGQRQRIAIARALYYNPSIMVLDEATSALDNDTETAVMESIDALQGSKTLIIVAHRLSTIRNCDKIYEIRDGKAVLRTKEEVFS